MKTGVAVEKLHSPQNHRNLGDRKCLPKRRKSWQTVRAMAERNFIVLRYEGKVPAMAGCEKCKRKFFTPAIYSRDAVGAEARENQRSSRTLLNRSEEHT